MPEQIRESLSLEQRINETYDETHICFTELEYRLSVPLNRNSKNACGYYHQYYNAWRNFHLLFHLTYNESEIRKKLGADTGPEWIEMTSFFNSALVGQGPNLRLALNMIRLWKKYDRILRAGAVISLRS